MGDMADWALEGAEMCSEDELDYATGKISREEAYELGVIDEFGGEFRGMRPQQPSGPGPCPKCGGTTYLVGKGPFGPFYGCSNFPACKGNRSYVHKEQAPAEKKTVQLHPTLDKQFLVKFTSKALRGIGMIVANMEREFREEEPAYSEEAFYGLAKEVEKLLEE